MTDQQDGRRFCDAPTGQCMSCTPDAASFDGAADELRRAIPRCISRAGTISLVGFAVLRKLPD